MALFEGRQEPAPAREGLLRTATGSVVSLTKTHKRIGGFAQHGNIKCGVIDQNIQEDWRVCSARQQKVWCHRPKHTKGLAFCSAWQQKVCCH